MTSKERIKKSLNFKKPDRIGIYDIFTDETVKEWKDQGLPSDKKIEDHFGYDFEVVPLENGDIEVYDEKKFVSLSISEPFSKKCYSSGLEQVLGGMVYEPKRAIKEFGRITDDIIKSSSSLLEKTQAFDGVWLHGDLGYQRGPLFSIDTYKKMLMPLHKELCRFFESKGLEIIFHSHGNIKEIIPLLLGMGVKAVEPLETESGMDIFELRKEYKKDLVLFGNISFNSLKSSKEAFSEELEKKLAFMKEDGGYIYRMDKDITPDISFKDYSFAVDLVKKHGEYQCQ